LMRKEIFGSGHKEKPSWFSSSIKMSAQLS